MVLASKRAAATVMLVFLFVISGAVHVAERQGFITVTKDWSEATNVMLFLLCGVLSLIVHFVHRKGTDWFFGVMGVSLIAISAEPFDGGLNLGVMMMTSTFLAMVTDAVINRRHEISELSAQEIE